MIVFNKRNLIILLSVIFGIVVFFLLKSKDNKKDIKDASIELAPTEEEAVVIDPPHHKIQIIKPGKIRVIDLPDRPTRVALMKGDGIMVTAPQAGTEMRPFLVGAFDLNGGKLGVGIDAFYWNRVDIGGGFLINPSKVQDTVLFVGVSYFIYSNTSITLGITNQIKPVLGIKVRL